MSEIKYKSKKLDDIRLDRLHYQWLPAVTSMEIWDYDMGLPNSPQVECARLLLEHGKNWGKLKNCRFAEDRRFRYKAGLKKWTEEAIKEHILGSRYKILKSLRKHGFDKSLSKQQPISILMQPLWRTRFKYDEEWLEGWEIYHGGRRCASAYVLGWETIPGMWAEDKYPGTCLGGKFKRKLRLETLL